MLLSLEAGLRRSLTARDSSACQMLGRLGCCTRPRRQTPSLTSLLCRRLLLEMAIGITVLCSKATQGQPPRTLGAVAEVASGILTRH